MVPQKGSAFSSDSEGTLPQALSGTSSFSEISGHVLPVLRPLYDVFHFLFSLQAAQYGVIKCQLQRCLPSHRGHPPEPRGRKTEARRAVGLSKNEAGT